mmetsp:Transcript_31505/g.90743  ORF Transcript_31505/g.90743 Transcript_31505/m.90743 type:complete len:200 (+) Transcript_31505:177-776(+)
MRQRSAAAAAAALQEAARGTPAGRRLWRSALATAACRWAAEAAASHQRQAAGPCEGGRDAAAVPPRVDAAGPAALHGAIQACPSQAGQRLASVEDVQRQLLAVLRDGPGVALAERRALVHRRGGRVPRELRLQCGFLAQRAPAWRGLARRSARVETVGADAREAHRRQLRPSDLGRPAGRADALRLFVNAPQRGLRWSV